MFIEYKSKFHQLKKDKLENEYKIRSEIVSKWSNRCEEQAKYYKYEEIFAFK